MALHRSTSLMRGLPCTLLPGPSSFVRQPLFCSLSIRQKSFRSGSARRQICRAGEPQHRENPARGQEVFRHFTDHSIRAILSSQREAEALRDVEVKPVHILLGLLAWDSWRLREFLGAGTNVNKARRIAKELFEDDRAEQSESGEGDAETVPALPTLKETAEIPFSTEASSIFRDIAEEADRLEERIILPEHILLAVFSSNDLKVQLVLDRLGINKRAARQLALQRLGLLPKESEQDQPEAAQPEYQQPPQTDTPTSTMPEGQGTLLETAFAEAESEVAAPVISDPNSYEDLQEESSALTRFCYDLTESTKEKDMDQVIGRAKELTRVIQILARKSKNNPVLVGEPGTGKTAIAEGLAAAIARGKDSSGQRLPAFLLQKRVLVLDVGLLMAGSKWVGVLEKRVTKLLQEVSDAGNIILVIDEIHNMVGAGGFGDDGGAGLNIGNLMKPALARGRLQVIGATTLKEHRQHFEKDPALERRFQPVLVEEPTPQAALQILQGLKAAYESYHNCQYTAEALEAAVSLSNRYIPDRCLPDKAIDLIDEAGSKARIIHFEARREQGLLSYVDYAVKLQQVMAKKSECVWAGKDAEASTWKAKELELRKKQDVDQAAINHLPAPVIHASDVAEVVRAWTSIPVAETAQPERETLLNLSKTLKSKVIGQDAAVDGIVSAVLRSRSGLRDPNRPVVSLMFCGPSGVGKTELAKALASSYFGSESAMVRIDMSEYMEQHSVAKLIGAPPGYVGYGETGTLTEAVKRQPHCLLLLDEIEKAHSDVFNLLLQVLDDGRLTESDGRSVSFKEAMIIMTSNVGAEGIKGGRMVGFDLTGTENSNSSAKRIKERVTEELKCVFQPEFLNRLDDIVSFNMLDESSTHKILALLIQQTSKRLEESHACKLQLDGGLVQELIASGISKEYGARPLRRAITSLIEDPLADAILDGSVVRGETVFLSWNAQKKKVSVKRQSPAEAPQLSSNIVAFKRSPSSSKLNALH